MEKKQNNALIDGVQSALVAFLIMLGISLILSVAVNLSVYEKFSELMAGTLGKDTSASVSSILKITIMIFNMSLFNAVGNMRLGIVVLAVIPFIGFYISNKRLNEDGVLSLYKCKVYGISTGLFVILQVVMSFITKGELVDGLMLNFVSFTNILSTIVIVYLLQLFILMNTKSIGKSFDGIIAFRHTYRTLGIIGGVVGLIAIIFGLKSLQFQVVMLLLIIIVALPNVIVYSFFYMSGLTMAFNEEIRGGLNYLGIDPTLQNMVYLRYGAVLIFIIVIAIFTLWMKKDKFFYMNTLLYSLVTGIFFGLLGYYSSIHIANIPAVGNVEFNVNNYLLSGLIPFGTIWLVAFIYYLVGKMKRIINE